MCRPWLGSFALIPCDCRPVHTAVGTAASRYGAEVHAVAYEVEIRIPSAQSLKDRRQVVRSLLDGARHRFSVSAAEVGGQDTWQSATLGFAVVASEARLADGVIDRIDQFLWARPEIEIVRAQARWVE